eukprot:jgi/Ulvmu1/9466/UM052_0034.1
MDAGPRARMRDTNRDEQQSAWSPTDVGLNIRQLTSPFQLHRPASGWPSWCIVVGGAYVLLMCVFAGIGLGTIIATRSPMLTIVSEGGSQSGGQSFVRQSTRFETGSVKSLDDFIRLKQLPRHLLTHSDMQFCPNIPEPQTDELYRVPDKVNVLMVIGTQKTGTTWLFEALQQHPSFIAAIRRPGEDRALAVGSLRAKEPQYFNRWPLPPVGEYLHAWHSGVIGAMISDAAGRRVLLDASPQYLMCAAAPPRIRAAVPHAKFIMVVRDAPIRTLSDFIMMGRLPDCSINPSRLCPLPDFLEQVQYELNDPKWRPECFFNGTEPGTTWWDCHQCHFGYIDQKVASGACAELERTGPPDLATCAEPSHRFIDHGLYAAQLAWWLRFFPPEQFLIISSWQLRDPEERIRVLNRIVDFSGMSGAQLFTDNMVAGLVGFQGNYSRADLSANDTLALGMLREYFRKPQEDLEALVNTFWPEGNFRIDPET